MFFTPSTENECSEILSHHQPCHCRVKLQCVYHKQLAVIPHLTLMRFKLYEMNAPYRRNILSKAAEEAHIKDSLRVLLFIRESVPIIQYTFFLKQ
jgi:hypothetical protein